MTSPANAATIIDFFARSGRAVEMTVAFYEERLLQLRLSPSVCVAMKCSDDGRDLAWLDGDNWTHPHGMRIEQVASVDDETVRAFGAFGGRGCSLLLELGVLWNPDLVGCADALRHRVQVLEDAARANGDAVGPIARGLRDGLCGARQHAESGPSAVLLPERRFSVTSFCRFVPGKPPGTLVCVGALAVAQDSADWYFAPLPGHFGQEPEVASYIAHGIASGRNSCTILDDFVDRANGITVSCSRPEEMLAQTARSAAFRHLHRYFADTFGLPGTG